MFKQFAARDLQPFGLAADAPEFVALGVGEGRPPFRLVKSTATPVPPSQLKKLAPEPPVSVSLPADGCPADLAE